MRRNRDTRRVVVETAHDEDGYYFCIGTGELVGTGEFVGTFVTEADRDRELGYEIAAIRRTVEEAGGRLRASSGGSWVIEDAPIAA